MSMRQIKPAEVQPWQILAIEENGNGGEPHIAMTESGYWYRYVETTSFPDEGRVFCRMVPGYAATAEWVSIEQLLVPYSTLGPAGRWFVHQANVVCGLGFPTDMLRCDGCQPAIPHRPENWSTLKSASIVQVSRQAKPRWTEGRWRSFSSRIEPVRQNPRLEIRAFALRRV